MVTLKSFLDSVSEENRIIVNPKSAKMDNSTIIFRGQGNILYVEDGVTLCNSYIDFYGDNGLLYISRNHNNVIVSIIVHSNCSVYIGRYNYFNKPLQIIAAERENVLIGNHGLFSNNISMRTADPHVVYDIHTRERINYSKSILIGDHVWIGQSAQIFKGTQIGSGSIVGGGAVVAGKRIPSNQSWAGNPARLLKRDVFFTGDCVNKWTETQTEEKSHYEADDFIYGPSANRVENLEEINQIIKSFTLAEQRLEIVKQYLVKVSDKNRFYIAEI